MMYQDWHLNPYNVFQSVNEAFTLRLAAPARANKLFKINSFSSSIHPNYYRSQQKNSQRKGCFLVWHNLNINIYFLYTLSNTIQTYLQ